MKKINIYIWIWISLSSFLFIQCNDVDELYKKYLDEGDNIYLGKNDSLIALSGIGFLQLKWYVSADPKIEETVIYWNMRQDSIIKPFIRTENGVQPDSIFIENLPIGVYTFELFNRNNSGYRSLISSIQGEVYEIPSVNLLTIRDTLFMLDEEIQTANYSAFYSGIKAPKDINVKFGVDPSLVDEYNQSYHTFFKPMPIGSYSLEATESVIPSGKNSTPLLKISFNMTGDLEPFTDYLLPLVIETSDAEVNERRSVSYFIVLGFYPPGQIPRRLVNENIPNSIELFSYLDKSLITRSVDGIVRSYHYDTINGVFETPALIATNWTVATVPFIASTGLNNRKLIVTDGGWILWIVTWDENGSTPLPEPTNFGALNRYLFTAGANIFNRLIWTSRDDGMFGRWGDGSLTYFKLNENWTAYAGISARNYVNWGNQRIIFVYKGDFITIDAIGDMWFYEYNIDNSIGNPKKIGSGWNMYTHVTPFGDKLIARDASGKLWEYQFDLRGFWALE